MKPRTVWKVVYEEDDVRYSSFAEGKLRVTYPLGRAVRGRWGPLFAFETKSAALKHVRELRPVAWAEIWKCEATGVQQAKWMIAIWDILTARCETIRQFWDEKKPGCYLRHQSPPERTVLCESIRLVKRVHPTDEERKP